MDLVMNKRSPKPGVDWELVEREYRAGLKTLRQIGEEHGVSHTAIQKKARQWGWVRDLSERIQQKAKNKIARQVVARSVSRERELSDTETVEAYSDVLASVDMIQRQDLRLAIDNSRRQLQELVTLSDPKFRDTLEAIAAAMDESGPTNNGGWKTDKVNEMYRYVISLAGRIKMSKEIAAAYAVYIPIQRKIFGLDGERWRTTGYEDLLRRIGEEAA
jgi:hypothetical protein